MRDDRNYYELTRGPVDGPAPGDVRYPHLTVTVPNRPVRALSATVLIGLGCERLHREGAGDDELRTFLDLMIAAGEPPDGADTPDEYAAIDVLRTWFQVRIGP